MPHEVLILDDDTAITDLLSMLLKSHGFEVITANTAREGLELMKDRNPGVVILDLMMPDKDGMEVCKAVRLFSNVPILILSAINDPRMIASVLDEGADDYLIKPVPSNVLVAHIRKLIRRTGGLEINPVQKPTALPGTQPLAS